MASHPTSIRLTPAEKRKINAAARRRGLSPAAYIKKAALDGVAGADDERLAKLEKLAAELREAVEDERDSRAGDAAWEKHLAGKARLLAREEFLRAVDV
jgi:hypothetical protein